MLKFILWVSGLGAAPDDTPEVRLQKAIQVNAVVLGGLPFQFGLAAFFGGLGAYFSMWTVLMFATLSLTNLLWLARQPRSFPLFKFVQLFVAVVSPAVGTLCLGGFLESGIVQIWGVVAPMLALMLYTPRQAVNWLVFYFVVLIGVSLIAPLMPVLDRLPPEIVNGIALVNVALIVSMMFAALYFFVKQRELAFQLLRGEQEKSENLLLNILPQDIATILKNENRVIADSFEGASILFADVVNFTPMSAQMTPVELVELLNEVFTYFDALVEKYGLEKIKTIGDCYMVASGVPRPRPDHAQALTHLALDMQAYVASREFHGRQLAFRIGLNSGPVVAGVIGRKKFIYDLWGDAVNTASRMEAHGGAGLIQITRTTYELVKDDFVCEPRGVVNVKGKGEMEVWQVVKAKEAGR
jgi:guanylate cyclase